MVKKITVIGGGNSGQAVAADCKLGGSNVTLFEMPAYEATITSIKETRRIELFGPELSSVNFKRNGVATLDCVTTDIANSNERHRKLALKHQSSKV